MNSTNKQVSDVIEPISDEKLSKLIGMLAQAHGIEFVATPEEWESINHDEHTASIAVPDMDITQNHLVLPIDMALNGHQPEFVSFLLYEVQTSLCDAGLDYADTEARIIIRNDGSISVNHDSPIPLSMFLLSIDHTLEKLSKLMTPEFYDQKAVSPVWFARSLSTLQGQPQFALNNTISLSME